MRDQAVIALLLVLVIASAGGGYFVGNSGRQTMTTTVTSLVTTMTGQSIAPFFPTYYVNGETNSIPCLNFTSGSQSWNVTANYPWKTQNDEYPPRVTVDYSIGTWPPMAVPSWLNLSVSPSMVELTNGMNSTNSLFATTNTSAPSGQVGQFSINASFADPISGRTVSSYMLVEVIANATASEVQACRSTLPP